MRTFLQNLNQPAENSSYTPLKSFAGGVKESSRNLTSESSINHHFNEVPLFPSAKAQTKLTVNQPNDPNNYRDESEADAVADRVTQMPEKNAAAGNVNSPHGSNSKKMDSKILAYMSDSFGFNFNNINIHTNEEAVNKNRELNARAFTIGNNIYFNEGEYNPESSKGKHLLAHELTHTIQQSSKGLSIQKDDKDKTDAKKPDIDFHLLPPDLKIRFWHLAFEADTSQVKLDYETKGLRTGLSYKYGGALALSLRSGITSGSVGFTPGENQLQLGLSQGPFRAGVSGTPGQNKYGLTLGFGDKLLPSPSGMSETFTTGGAAAGNMLTGAPAALDDPIAYYKAHKEDIDNVSKSVDLFKDITDSGKKKLRFGGDFSLSYDPEKHLVYTVRVGAMYKF